jgi:DNA-binding CsgD family transcriptional regulator
MKEHHGGEVNQLPRNDAQPLAAARAAYAKRAWSAAYEGFAHVEVTARLDADDLQRLATAAYLVGRDDEFYSALERAYQGYAGTDLARATRCAFWLGLTLLFAGKLARANGWLSRAQQHVDSGANLEVEVGLLLIPRIERQLLEGDWDAARATAKRAVAIGEKFADPDLRACARHQLGRALIGACEVDEGFMLLDQVMLEVTEGTVSPIMTGLVYCSVIDACQQVYAVARAREWTEALADWCEAQPQMIAFSGTCLVHRAELMQLNGQWPSAVHEARLACARYANAGLEPSGAAFYQQAEVHRLRGDYEAAEECYGQASQSGFEPQPGLALLRLAQGNRDVAQASIRRIMGTSCDRLQRLRLLPACAEIMLAVGELAAARHACSELSELAQRFGTDVLVAMAAQVEAAVALAEGDAQRALGLARGAFHTWQRVQAPYEAARARTLAGMACRALADGEGARLELEAAMATLEQLGASPELDRVQKLARGSQPGVPDTHGLTPRELEVLRLVAAGMTNKAIGGALFVSDKTVDRHLSNIFNKLDVSTRTAAAAYAYEHKLI